MRYEERASLSRSRYQNFQESYLRKELTEKIFWGMSFIATIATLLFLFAVVSGKISLSSFIVIAVFLALAFSLRGSERS